MSSRNLFNIILKVIGIFIIKDTIAVIIGIASTLPYAVPGTEPLVIELSVLVFVIAIALYLLPAYFLIFKTEKIIDKLKLESDLPENIDMNIHRSTVISIAIIITGSLILIDAIPILCKDLITFYQLYFSRLFTGEKRYTAITLELSKIIIALLLLGNRRAIVNFIEYRSRNRKRRE